jgi:hypothetical protein
MQWRNETLLNGLELNSHFRLSQFYFLRLVDGYVAVCVRFAILYFADLVEGNGQTSRRISCKKCTFVKS